MENESEMAPALAKSVNVLSFFLTVTLVVIGGATWATAQASHLGQVARQVDAYQVQIRVLEEQVGRMDERLKAMQETLGEIRDDLKERRR